MTWLTPSQVQSSLMQTTNTKSLQVFGLVPDLAKENRVWTESYASTSACKWQGKFQSGRDSSCSASMEQVPLSGFCQPTTNVTGNLPKQFDLPIVEVQKVKCSRSCRDVEISSYNSDFLDGLNKEEGLKLGACWKRKIWTREWACRPWVTGSFCQRYWVSQSQSFIGKMDQSAVPEISTYSQPSPKGISVRGVAVSFLH